MKSDQDQDIGEIVARAIGRIGDASAGIPRQQPHAELDDIAKRLQALGAYPFKNAAEWAVPIFMNGTLRDELAVWVTDFAGREFVDSRGWSYYGEDNEQCRAYQFVERYQSTQATLYSWTITFIGQEWRIDAPQRYRGGLPPRILLAFQQLAEGLEHMAASSS